MRVHVISDIGMYTTAGTNDWNMNHTFSGRDYQRLWFNGVEVGETGSTRRSVAREACPVLLETGSRVMNAPVSRCG